MTTVRLGAVGYLNARPLVYGLDRSPRFQAAFRRAVEVRRPASRRRHRPRPDSVDRVPARAGRSAASYRIVPGVSIASRGPVASVALYTRRTIRDVRSIALDTSSRTSVALVRVLCARAFRIRPMLYSSGPRSRRDAREGRRGAAHRRQRAVPRVGRPDAVEQDRPRRGVDAMRPACRSCMPSGRAGPSADRGRRGGTAEGARSGNHACRRDRRRLFQRSASNRRLAARYLRDNIKYDLGDDERAGLERFYTYAAEAGVVKSAQPLGSIRAELRRA